MTDYTFEATAPVRIDAITRASDLAVHTSDSSQVAVRVHPFRDSSSARSYAEDTLVDMSGSELRIEVPRSAGIFFANHPRLRIDVHVPFGSALKVSTGSGEVTAEGRLDEVRVRSGSGDVTLPECGPTEVTTGSGNITVHSAHDAEFLCGSGSVRLGTATGQVRAKAGSGDVIVSQAADISVTAASGDIKITTLAGTGRLRAASGNLIVQDGVHGSLNASTASGDILVGVHHGTAVYMDCYSAAGRLVSDLESSEAPGDQDQTLEVYARAASGDVRITRAA